MNVPSSLMIFWQISEIFHQFGIIEIDIFQIFDPTDIILVNLSPSIIILPSCEFPKFHDVASQSSSLVRKNILNPT